MHECKTLKWTEKLSFPQNDPVTKIPPIIMHQDEFMHRLQKSSSKTEKLEMSQT